MVDSFGGDQIPQRAVDLLARFRTDKASFQQSRTELNQFKQIVNDAFAPDNASLAKARASFSAHRAELKLNRGLAKEMVAEYDTWNKVLGNINRESAIDQLTAQMVKAVKSGKDLGEVLEAVKLDLRDIGATEAEVSRVIKTAQTASAGTGGRALQQFGREAKLAVPALPIPGTGVSSESLFRIVEVTGKVSQAFSALSPVMKTTIAGAGLLGIGIAALAIGFDSINEQFAKQTRAIINSQEEVTRLRLQGSREEIEAAIAKKRQEDEITQARIDENKRLLQSIEGSTTPLGNALADILNVAGVQELRKATQELEQDLLTNAVATGRLTGVLADQEVQTRLATEASIAYIQAQTEALQQQQFAAVQIRTTFSALAGGTAEAARSRLNALQAERDAIETVIQQRNLTGESIKQLNEQFSKLGDEARLIIELLPELEDIERRAKAQADQEEAQEALIQLTQRAIDIESQGKQKLANIIEQGNRQIESAEEKLADTRTKLTDLATDAAEKRRELDSDFMKEDLERIREFRTRERKIQKDADLQRLRDLQDHEDTLADAEEANDVSAFIREQRRFERENKERQQDVDIAAQERLDGLEQERQKARDNRDERLAALQAETDKKRTDLQTELQERQAALEQVKEDIRQRLQVERDAIRQALQELVTGLDTSTQRMTQTITQGFAILEQAGINTFSGIIGDLERRARVFISQGQQPRIQTGPPPPLPANYRPGTAFATGGIPTRPTVGLLSEKASSGLLDALIPFRRSEGIGPALERLGLTGGNTITISFGDIGTGVSQIDLDALENRVIIGVARGLERSRSNG